MSSFVIEKTTPAGRNMTGSGTLFDRITGFSNEKKADYFIGRPSTSTEKSNEKATHVGIDCISSSTVHHGDPSLVSSNRAKKTAEVHAQTRCRLETTVLDVSNVVHSPKSYISTDAHSFQLQMSAEADASTISFLDCAISPIKRDKHPERSFNTSKTFLLTSSEVEAHSHERSKVLPDVWREVTDPESGRRYFYNRRTRVSKWRLPKGAVLSQKMSINSSFATAVTFDSESHLSIGQQQHYIERSTPAVLQRKECTSRRATAVVNEITASMKHPFPYVNDTTVSRSDLKSPQDTTKTFELLFCLYCGLKCRSISILESHLPECSCFIEMQQEAATQMEIERVLFNLWSKIGSNGQATVVNSSSQEDTQSPSKECRVCEDDGYTISPQKFNVRKNNKNNDSCLEKKTCCFCEETLIGGDQFSSHLLKCKERKRRRKKRQTPKKTFLEESSTRMRVRTPGRRMPWE